MRKRILIGLLSCIYMVLPSHAFAVDLIDVFHDALACDPTFQADQAIYLADKENLPIARSAILPNINLTGYTQRQYVEQSLSPFFGGGAADNQSSFYNTENYYVLNASQPIFDVAAWTAVASARYQVKQAEATFAAAAQDLMMRTAQAYFNVLQANDNLRFTLAQKRSVGRQLLQAKQQYEVGLIAITGASEAQANYDAIVANEIAARNNLAVAMEQLRAITGKTYWQLMGAPEKLPLVKPNPINIMEWINIAENQNYSLRAAIEGANAAQQNVKTARAGHYPIIDATAGYSYNDNSNPASTGIGNQEIAQVGLTLNLPIYQGGLVTAQTRQADFYYQQAISNMEFTHRNVILQARQSYLGVITGISKVQADRQAVISAITSLKATQEGYSVGTRTIIDVLLSTSNLYQAQKNFTTDQYNYLINILLLKEAAGTLSPSDLVEINCWLTKNVEVGSKIAAINDYVMNGSALPRPTYREVVSSKKSSDKKVAQRQLALNKAEQKKLAMLEKANTATKSAKVVAAGYGISLFDTRYKQHAIDFINDHDLKDKAIYIAVKNKAGESRYQVIYGKYKTETAAQAAMKNLPQQLQQLHPWVLKIPH